MSDDSAENKYYHIGFYSEKYGFIGVGLEAHMHLCGEASISLFSLNLSIVSPYHSHNWSVEFQSRKGAIGLLVSVP